MKDVIRQEIQIGDFIYNNEEIGVVYGTTPGGEIRFYMFRILRVWNDNDAKNPEEIFEVGHESRFRIENKPSKKYTRNTTPYFKLSLEQFHHYFDTYQFYVHHAREMVQDQRITDIIKNHYISLREDILL